jgi:hypothetical protein
MTMMNWAQNPPGRLVRKSLHRFLAAEGPEGRGQHRRTEQDDEHQRGGLGGLDHHAMQRVVDLERAPARSRSAQRREALPATIAEGDAECGRLDVHRS